VIAESEGEALQQEQRQLQEALLRSKLTDSQPRAGENTTDAMRLVLLSFQRFPKELREALLSSPLAARLVAGGVELMPAWACRRLVLAHGVMEDSINEDRERDWHVAVRVVDEDVVQAIRLSVNPKVRPPMKDRFVVPAGASLFDVGSASSLTGQVVDLSHTIGPGSDWRELAIKNTFLCAPRESAISHARAKSAPP